MSLPALYRILEVPAGYAVVSCDRVTGAMLDTIATTPYRDLAARLARSLNLSR